MVPRVSDDNTQFLQGVRLLASLREGDAIELAFGTIDETEDSSDPIPRSAVQGRDVLNAAKDGYVYRTRGGEPDDPAQAGKGARPQGSPRLRPLPRDAGSVADLPPDPGPEQVPDQVGADGGATGNSRAHWETTRST